MFGQFKADIEAGRARIKKESERKILQNAAEIYLNQVLELNSSSYAEGIRIKASEAITMLALKELCPLFVRSLTLVPGITAERDMGEVDWNRQNFQLALGISPEETIDGQ